MKKLILFSVLSLVPVLTYASPKSDSIECADTIIKTVGAAIEEVGPSDVKIVDQKIVSTVGAGAMGESWTTLSHITAPGVTGTIRVKFAQGSCFVSGLRLTEK